MVRQRGKGKVSVIATIDFMALEPGGEITIENNVDQGIKYRERDMLVGYEEEFRNAGQGAYNQRLGGRTR
jgi:hypothetical protein